MAERAGDDPVQPVEVSRHKRLVDPELDRQLMDLGWSGVDAEQLLRGVAREVADDRERQQRHAPQDRDRHQQPARDEPQRRRLDPPGERPSPPPTDRDLQGRRRSTHIALDVTTRKRPPTAPVHSRPRAESAWSDPVPERRAPRRSSWPAGTETAHTRSTLCTRRPGRTATCGPPYWWPPARPGSASPDEDRARR